MRIDLCITQLASSVQILPRVLRALAWVLLACTTAAGAQDLAAANALRERHAALRDELAHNAFGRPVHLDSKQVDGDLSGEIHAVLEHPFARLRSALGTTEHWCDVLILHINTKQCRAAGGPPANQLVLFIGSKRWQALESAQRVAFDFHVIANSADYLRIELHADKGPMSSSNYRIVLEAIPLEAGRSFIHLSYAYAYGLAGRLAMQGYLSTVGSGKVGFTVIGTAGGKPVYIDGVRGVIERNTMRYYLAIDAYAGTIDAAPRDLPDVRLRRWYAEADQYPRQLHELEEAEYLDTKRKEIERQRGT
jgi:hypothetical protein